MTLKLWWRIVIWTFLMMILGVSFLMVVAVVEFVGAILIWLDWIYTGGGDGT